MIMPPSGPALLARLFALSRLAQWVAQESRTMPRHEIRGWLLDIEVEANRIRSGLEARLLSDGSPT